MLKVSIKCYNQMTTEDKMHFEELQKLIYKDRSWMIMVDVVGIWYMNNCIHLTYIEKIDNIRYARETEKPPYRYVEIIKINCSKIRQFCLKYKNDFIPTIY